MILADEILLLLTDARTGRALLDTGRLELVLAGALLLDLAADERVDVAGPGGPVKAGRVVVRDPRPVGEQMLDHALAILVSRAPCRPEAAVTYLKTGLRPGLYGRMVDRGVLRAETHRTLRIFTTERWPALDTRHADQVRAGLRDVLVVGRTPTGRERATISLLHTVDAVPRVLGTAELPTAELRRRAKAVSTSGVAETAVRRALDAMNAAVTTMIITSTDASS